MRAVDKTAKLSGHQRRQASLIATRRRAARKILRSHHVLFLHGRIERGLELYNWDKFMKMGFRSKASRIAEANPVSRFYHGIAETAQRAPPCQPNLLTTAPFLQKHTTTNLNSTWRAIRHKLENLVPLLLLALRFHQIRILFRRPFNGFASALGFRL